MLTASALPTSAASLRVRPNQAEQGKKEHKGDRGTVAVQHVHSLDIGFGGDSAGLIRWADSLGLWIQVEQPGPRSWHLEMRAGDPESGSGVTRCATLRSARGAAPHGRVQARDGASGQGGADTALDAERRLVARRTEPYCPFFARCWNVLGPSNGRDRKSDFKHVMLELGRPGLDPGTLGLRERFRSSSRCSSFHQTSSSWVLCPADVAHNCSAHRFQ